MRHRISVRQLSSYVILVPIVVLGLFLGACKPNSAPPKAAPTPAAQAVAVPAPAPAPAVSAEGQTVPKPVFQRGDELVKPLADGSPAAQDFVSFFNATYLTGGPRISLLGAQDVVWFPPQMLGDTSFQAVHRGTPAESLHCNDPSGYPIVCADDFSTSDFCQACHDSALFVSGGGLPAMSYFSSDDKWLANWTQYGDWSASIMALATRDPIWQAQIETETNVHNGVDPTYIQDICFRCHGAMGERQLQSDHEASFCTDVFYATIPGIAPSTNRGQPYPFSDHCAPLDGKPVGKNQDAYAKYGALARDGVSCEVCHRLGPPGGDSGAWNGTDFTVFYGPEDAGLPAKQTDNPWPLTHDFTATFEYDKKALMTPDPIATLDVKPMRDDDKLELAHAVDQKNNVSYLRQSILCGSCHVLIVPQIPTGYKASAPLPNPEQFPYYDKPASCNSTTFAADGNPVTDPCVAVSYEQATYLEWINSAFASEQDNENTCQACHMPLVTDPKDASNHGAIMAQATEGLTPKQYRRHRMMGINMFVFEMFAQFPDVLGVELNDQRIPAKGVAKDGTSAPFIQHNLLNGEMGIVEQATSQANGNGLDPTTAQPMPQAAAEIDILSVLNDQVNLTANLNITNNTGHKFPSGAGFRRAFIRFEVLDAAGKVLWVSGDSNRFGAICDGPCKQTGAGTYNLLPSETPHGNPAKLQPHYELVNSQSQVQIYEVQDVDDSGTLTSSTLALFHDAKDNRILPRGWTPPDVLGCDTNPNAGTTVFGIAQCQAAGATVPQYKPLTKGSSIASDPNYTNPALTGSDTITYQVPLAGLAGKPASVRATMRYQTIPPGYLAARFTDGYQSSNSSFLPATKRAIYLTSHLNTDLALTSTHPKNKNLPITEGWTMNIYQAVKALN